MKPKKQKLNQTEKKMYDFLEALAFQENAIFCVNTFRDNGKIMSMRIKRVCDVWNTPHGCEKGNSEDSNTNYLETRKTTEEANKHECKTCCPDNQHPVGVCIMCINGMCNSDYNRGMLCDGINVTKGCPYKNGGSFAMAIYDKKNERKSGGDYVLLNDVLGLFKNRKLTKTKVKQREHIVQHLNKLKKYKK